MKVLITGVSSGIGRALAIQFSNLGYDIIGVARHQEEMLKLKSELKTDFVPICLDLSKNENIDLLYDKVKDEDITVLVNNAGIANYGQFKDVSISDDMNVINLNILALQRLMKLFIHKMELQEKGYILNVASLAGLMPCGPYMSVYYATKSYVVSLSEAVSKELEEEGSPVRVSALCVGPVDTDFNKKMGIEFNNVKPLSAEYVAKYTISKLFSDKSIIIPGTKNKLLALFSRFLSRKSITKINYNIQKNKGKFKNKVDK